MTSIDDPVEVEDDEPDWRWKALNHRRESYGRPPSDPRAARASKYLE
jgi:hypothetical protein